ncbi:MAG: hypothetical protein FVQ80_00875 [Planctomycetes bacterium]|nr:hypothetical protein [Planctomycetota bacterium]
MVNPAISGAGAGAVIATNAISAIGSIVIVEPNEFISILEKSEKPIAVHSPSGFMTKHKYITSYKGLVFFTKSSTELIIPSFVEIIKAKKIFIPQM